MNIIKQLNNSMNDYLKSWEIYNTEETFLELTGGSLTKEIKIEQKKNIALISKIEVIINNKKYFEKFIENRDLIDYKALDILVDTYDLNIDTFKNYIKSRETLESTQEVLIFIKGEKNITK